MRDLPSYLQHGFYAKYHIAKRSGTLCDPNAKYFVLRYDKDPHAVAALLAYARSIHTENAKFAQDILHEVYRFAQEFGLLDVWADVANQVSYHCKAPMQAKENHAALAKILNGESEERDG